MASGVGLKTRTSSTPPSRRSALTSAPSTVSSVPEAGRVPPPKAGRRLEREEHVVGQRVRVVAVDRQRVAQRHALPAHLQALDRRHRPGREGPVRHAEPREHAGRTEHGERERAGGVAVGGVVDVDQLVLADALVHHGQAAGRHEALGRCRRQPELVGSALGGEAACHHGERALGVRLGGRLGEREVHAEAVVAAGVHEAGRDPDGRLVGRAPRCRSPPRRGARRPAPGTSRRRGRATRRWR